MFDAPDASGYNPRMHLLIWILVVVIVVVLVLAVLRRV